MLVLYLIFYVVYIVELLFRGMPVWLNKISYVKVCSIQYKL